MVNLAGDNKCDDIILEELQEAGINVIVNKRSTGEVATMLHGEIPGFVFDRRWYYYSVKGKVPMETAMEIYSTKIGRETVRAYGHCGCVNPQEYRKNATYVDGYHIDSQKGLNLFVFMVKGLSK